MTIHRIGVTGHRKLLSKTLAVYNKFKEELLATIGDKDRQDFIVNTGMALGFDQVVAEVCLSLGVPYRAVVPCDGQDALWKPEQQAIYRELLAGAKEVINVNPGPYEAWKMHARNGWIVNNSDEMIVHWDGFYQGGTGNCMKLVRSKKLPYRNIHPITPL
jgi:uncharacterized phage-like protein YoqJ